MIEVHPNLYVGGQDDAFTHLATPGWFLVQAARDPWHRNALGYSGRGAPKDHAEYLMAHRPGALILNLVDAADPVYIPEAIVEAAIAAIHDNIGESQVLVHCNQGASRAPTLALLWLHRHTDRFANMSHEEAVAEFKGIYPAYAPAAGMDGYAKAHW